MNLYQKMGLKWILIFVVLFCSFLGMWYALSPQIEVGEGALYTSLPQPKTLDPAFASDYSSCVTTMSFFDTLFAYDYEAKPYKVIPSMLAKEPSISADGLRWDFTLRDDLMFRNDSCFNTNNDRKVTALDVRFSLLRMADPRWLAPSYSLIRDKIMGLDNFRLACEKLPKWNFSPYEKCDGFLIHSDTEFSILLTQRDMRLPYYLAMPYTAIVSEKSARFYHENWIEKVIGSGPFILNAYQRDYRMHLKRYEDYRVSFFRGKRLPCSEEIVCYLVQDLQPAWLMFLNGDLDISAINKDQLSIVGTGLTIPQTLQMRGIQLLTAPEMQINYIGISFADERLRQNLHLRRAISLAYDRSLRQTYYNGLISLATGPIPLGLVGHLPEASEYGKTNLILAKKEMVLAGYPNGIDSQTHQPLQLTFDLPETGVSARQVAEMMVRDMAKIGIEIKPMLNNKTKFIERNRSGAMQIFRFNWVGDYPDAENFFQLFYSKNAGSSNRAFYAQEMFDSLYEKSLSLSSSPQRDSLYQQMSAFLVNDVPWIFESQPLSFRLTHSWLKHYSLNDFSFDRWKYLYVDAEERKIKKAQFKPLGTSDLR